MRRILLTGATGFLGRQILQALSARGIHVRIVVRARSAVLPSTSPGHLEIVETPDLFAENRHWWRDVLDGMDAVIHAAWYVEPGKYLNSPLNIACLTGTLELAHGACLAGIRRFVGIGTCFEYDLSACLLSVDTPLRPTSLYAATKVAVYTTLAAWLPTHGVSFAWCRPFYLYGEGEDSRRFVPYIRQRLERGEPVDLPDGRQIRDYMDVRVAGQIIADIARDESVIGPFNICTGEPVTIRQLAERIADEYGRRDLLRFGTLPPRKSDPFCVVGVPNYPTSRSNHSEDE